VKVTGCPTVAVAEVGVMLTMRLDAKVAVIVPPVLPTEAIVEVEDELDKIINPVVDHDSRTCEESGLAVRII
jgi:hypothetical protein